MMFACFEWVYESGLDVLWVSVSCVWEWVCLDCELIWFESNWFLIICVCCYRSQWFTCESHLLGYHFILL